jgi:hypothetical protein
VDGSDADDYDADLDRGRTKKVRKAVTAPSPDSSQVVRSNPFHATQREQYHQREGSLSGEQSRAWQHRDRGYSRYDRYSDHGRRHSYGGRDYRGVHPQHHNRQWGGSHNRSYSDNGRRFSDFRSSKWH